MVDCRETEESVAKNAHRSSLNEHSERLRSKKQRERDKLQSGGSLIEQIKEKASHIGELLLLRQEGGGILHKRAGRHLVTGLIEQGLNGRS